MRNTIARLVALGLILAACSPGETEATSTTSTLASTTSSTTTTPTTTSEPVTTTSEADEAATSFINGLAVEDETLLDRRVLAVKLDNHYRARPQSGVDQADMVIELMVEGITRFLTIWHQSDVEYFGPMRSGRPTDPTLLAAFNEPTFSISGAQNWVQSLIRSKDIYLTGEVSPATFRISGRFAPHNLYVNTVLLREYADSRDYPDIPPEGPIWEFGPMPSSAEQVEAVRINFSGNIVNWEWDLDSQTWLRSVNANPSNWRNENEETGQIGLPVLVAVYVDQYTVSPSGGASGSSLPSSRTIGSGKAFVFADGKVVEGTWERESETEWFTLLDQDGEIIAVPPGKVWLSLVPSHSGLSFE